MPQLKICLEEEVVKRFPELEVTFLFVPESQPYTNGTLDAKVAEQSLLSRLYETFPDPAILDLHPFNEQYKLFYQSMGLRAKKVSTPIKQALRIHNLGRYRPLHPVIDYCMTIEYATLISFQVYDAQELVGSLRYHMARGDEAFQDLHNEEKLCKLGELVLSDDAGIVHSVYYGNAKRAAIGPATKAALVRIMRVPGIPIPSFLHAVTEAKQRFRATSVATLSANTPFSSLAIHATEKGR